MSGAAPVVAVVDLVKHYDLSGAMDRLLGRPRGFNAVDGVSFEIAAGQTFGLVGESGSGKSTIAKLVTRLTRPSGGRIEIEGRDWTRMSARELRPHRRNVQMIFQNPYGSLNPRLTVTEILAEPLVTHGMAEPAALRAIVAGLLADVGLRPEHARRYPHQFSGGQRQRIAIARALASRPSLLIADEPVSALDVSVQAQILNLLTEIKQQRRLSMLFISHDMAVVRHVSDRVGVLYLGRLVETAPVARIFAEPGHPYTRALLDAVPDPALAGRRRHGIAGDPPNPLNPPSGCVFRTRCPKARDLCTQQIPPLVQIGVEHLAACHFPSNR